MLKWVFGADTGPFRGSLNEMRTQVKSFSGSVTGQMAGIFGGGALVAGAAAIIEKFARLKDLADRFGESAESMQRVGYAAQQSGTDLEGVAKAMTKVTANAVKAARDGGEMAASFVRLGIDAASFANLPIEDKLLALSAGYDGSKSSGEGLNDIINVMGKSGSEMIPLLVQGAEALRKQMQETQVAGDGVVKTLADADDKIQGFKNGSAVAFAAVIAGLMAISGTISTVVLGALDVMIDNLIMIGRVGVNSATIIGKMLTGDFKGAAAAAMNFGTIVKSSMGNMVNDVKKTGDSISGIWDETFNGSSSTKKKGLDVEGIKEAAEAAKKAGEDRIKLTEDIGKMEEEARLRALSLTEKILDAEKRRAALAAEALFGGDETKALEARKAQLEIEKDIAGYRKEASEDAKKHQEAKDKLAADLDKAHDKEDKANRDNKFANLDDNGKVAMLKKERDQARKDADNLGQRGFHVEATEKRTEALSKQGEIDNLTRSMSSNLQKQLADAQKGGSRIATSSLADIGGGSGSFLSTVDHTAEIAQGIRELVRLAQQGNDIAKPGPPEAI